MGLRPVDPQAVRTAYDTQVRRRTQPDEPGSFIDADRGVLRWLAPGSQTSRIEWSGLSADNADAVIAAQVRYFAARGTPVEWKLYDYDEPADLGRRLLAAGFIPGEDELMLVAEAAAIDPDVVLPAGVALVPVRDEAGLDAMLAVHERAFSGVAPDLGERLRTRLRDAPEQIEMVVAMAGDEPVSAARVEFLPGTDFAGLWTRRSRAVRSCDGWALSPSRSPRPTSGLRSRPAEAPHPGEPLRGQRLGDATMEKW